MTTLKYLKQSFDIKQLVKRPTRAKVVLDKVYTNMYDYYDEPTMTTPLGLSDHNCVVCSVWKSADIIPLPKVANPDCIKKDIRPISLTPVLSKILERFVCDTLWKDMEPTVDRHQFGVSKDVLPQPPRSIFFIPSTRHVINPSRTAGLCYSISPRPLTI